MGTEGHEHDERIAAAIRSMADDEGRLAAPPAHLWGRIERAIDDRASAAPGLVPPPGELWDRIAEEVRSDAEPTVAPPVVRHHRRRSAAVVAAAAVVVCALAAAVVVATNRNSGPTTELVARASLSGVGLDPGGDSTGSAELLEGEAGWKVAIQVADLPDPPTGSYYEAWLLGDGPGQVQSLGALEGDDRFAVPDGLAIVEFPLVDISIEPIDGNPAHSSKSVLRGELEAT